MYVNRTLLCTAVMLLQPHLLLRTLSQYRYLPCPDALANPRKCLPHRPLPLLSVWSVVKGHVHVNVLHPTGQHTIQTCSPPHLHVLPVLWASSERARHRMCMPNVDPFSPR